MDRRRRRRALAASANTTTQRSSAPPLVISIPESVAVPVDRWCTRRALGPYTLSCAYWGFRHGVTNYALDITHGVGANAVTFNTSMSGRTRISVSLSATDQTAEQVCDACITALAGAGITATRGAAYTNDGVEVCDLSISGGSVYVAAPGMPLAHESVRGIWGIQRTDFGPADLGFQTEVGATPSQHFTMPATAGRTRGVVALNTSGAANIRDGLAAGPAYSDTPAAFSAGVEGIMTAGTDGLRRVDLTPTAYTSSANRWSTWRGAGGGDPSVAFRPFGQTPVGNGDLSLTDSLLSSSVSADPTVAIYTAGAYTHNAGLALPGSPFGVYAAWAIIYEQPNGDGDYYGDGSIDTYHGYHGTADGGGGTPTQANAATLEGITESFRRTFPLDGQIVGARFALADAGVGDSCGFAIYDWTGITLSAVPAVGTIERLTPASTDAGDLSTGSGYRTITLATPVDVVAGGTYSDSYAWAAPSGDLATLYDEPGAAGAYLTGWVDNGREWCDMVDYGPGARGADAQYVTISGGDMPVGDGAATVWPATFDAAASDLLPDNHFRAAVRFRRRGIELVSGPA